MRALLPRPPHLDERGRKVDLFDPFSAEAGELDDDQLDRLKHRVRTAWRRLPASFMLALLILVLGLFYFDNSDAFSFPEPLLYGWFALLTIPWAIGFARTARYCRQYELKRTLLEEQRCPACAMSLSSVPVEDDEKTECPRCHSAWRVPARHWRQTVGDARGHTVKLFDPEAAQLTGSRGSLTREQLAELSKRAQTSWNLLRYAPAGKSIPLVIPLIVGFTILTLPITSAFSPRSWVDSLFFVVASAVMLWSFGFWWRHQRWQRRHDVLQWLLREGHCPSCTYPLGELPAQPDGCTVCPECGAAWRLDH